MPQRAQAFLDRPRPAGLEVGRLERGEALLVALGEVLMRVQPQVLGAGQEIQALGRKGAVLALSDLDEWIGRRLKP